MASAIERANILAFQAEAANAAKSAFLARMSHEIRTPLHAVIGYTEMLLESPLDQQQREYAEIIQRSGQTLLALIEDVLDFSKIEAGEMRLEKAPFRLGGLVEETCEIIRPRLRDKPVQLLYKISPDVPKIVLGDPFRTRQVLLNLLGNAAKFTDQGKIVLGVRLAEKGDEKFQLLFTVTDTGIGIPKHELSAIFQPFRQADDSISRRHGGTGLGLTICKQLAKLMEGDVWAQSEPGKGSTFFFSARFQRACGQQESSPCAEAQDTESPSVICYGSHRVPGQEDAGRFARILLVEDNEVNAKLARLMLMRAGHTVELASNGWEALKKFTAKSRELDLILMDVEMPGMDGLEATRRIRALGHTEIPILAMTAHAMKEDRERCLASGMNDYLSKPIRKEALLKAIEKWTTGREAEHGNP